MKTVIGVVLALAIVLFAVHGSLYAAGDAAKGKDLYLKKCKMCHAEDGAGTPAMVKKFGDKMKPLGSPAVQKMKDDELAKAFKDAADHKAIAKTVTDADVANLTAFIRTLKK
jgi:cytochrome c553